MDHTRFGPPAFNSGDPRLHFFSTTPSVLASEVPFYMHHVLNPNAPPPPPPPTHPFHHTTAVSPPPPPPPPPPTYSPQTGWNGYNGNGINLNQDTTNYAQSTTIRWPRQETLTLLEIRSRLDHRFKEATSSNHKAPLWDEISRIMKDEYGYQRSGRKCKEKFENLYKYYKKTKEGKVGKSDGKHYRFFRQLDALFGNQHDLGSTNSDIAVYPINQSNYSSDNKRCDYRLKKKELMNAIEESIESHFLKLMVKQEQWGEKILCTIEQKEQERVVIEEEWRKQETARLDQEYESWARNVARIKTRDKSLLEALQNLIRVRSNGSSYRNMNPKTSSEENAGCLSDQNKCKDWIEPEISSLIHIRTSKECKFQEHDEDSTLWEEVAFELSLLGYIRSEKDCKETWERICVDFDKTKTECEITSKELVCLRTSNSTMNINGERSWETM